MFADTACSVMGEMSAMMLAIMAFSSSRLYELLWYVLSLMQPHRKKSGGHGGHSPFEMVRSPNNRDSSCRVTHIV
jgi:hypothetical protein